MSKAVKTNCGRIMSIAAGSYQKGIMIIAILALSFLLISNIYSQDTGGGGQLADALGGKITLEVDGDKGEIVSNVKDGEFVSLIAKVDVVLKGENMDLTCDKMVYEAAKNNLTAYSESDKQVYIKFQDVEATCGKFVYDLTTKQAELTGNPKMIRGKGTNVSAPKIVLKQDENGNVSLIAKNLEGDNSQSGGNSKPKGRTSMTVDLNELKKSNKKGAANTIDNKKEPESQKIDGNNINKIPEQAPAPSKKKDGIISE